MEPVLQRFGDVTIQRLDKQKDDEEVTHQDEKPPTTLTGEKREGSPLQSPENSKKFKKNDSEPDTSEFDESDESEPEKPPAVSVSASLPYYDPNPPYMVPPQMLPPPTTMTNSTMSYFPAQNQFGGYSMSFNAPPGPQPPSAAPYNYDLKEKLKEMGEISFETVKKGDKPKKQENTENEVVVTPAKKPNNEEENAAERKGSNMRRNIREVMDETKLDEATLAAQRQEAERVRRLQEQQRIIREYQRQAAQDRMQHKVMSLLQGNNYPKPGTSSTTQLGPNTTRIGNTVLVKLPNGQTKSMTRLPKRPFDLMKVPKGGASPHETPFAPALMKSQIRPVGPLIPPQQPQQMNFAGLSPVKKPGTNLTPSVSIAPVAKKVFSPQPFSDTESESDYDEDMKSPDSKDKEDVQTIDISSDDDCIVVSEPEEEDDTDDAEDDPSNSGMHTNDEFNQPDEQGRVLVNVGHPDDEPDVFVAPQISRVIKPHQIGGVRFLFDNVVESTNRFESSTGFGCILAHSMGLGKTLQIVCFSDIFLRHTSAKTILCIMPINTLQNWMAEFNMWLPTPEGAPASPLMAHGEVRPRNFNLYVVNDSHKTLAARTKVIKAWRATGGVLLIGYEQYRLLSLRKHPKSRRKVTINLKPDDDKSKMMFDEVQEALVCPGPDLVICDEGHRIKNSHASISQALKLMRTKRRVVLTGYPLQNNLMEYWCMVDFVRPNYLGTKTEFCNMFERPIMNGQCIDSTEADIKLMRYRAHVLHSLLVGFVQRRSHTVLQTALPQKEEYVLLCRMSNFQRMLYETFMNEVVRIQAVPNPLKAFAVCCKIWNHPDVLYTFLKKRAGGEAVDIDLEEVGGTAQTDKEGATKKKPIKPKKVVNKIKDGKPEASITPYSTGDSSLEPSGGTLPANFPAQNTSNFQNFQSQNYFEQFDQNAQFPSSFPTPPASNTSDFNQTYPSSTSGTYQQNFGGQSNFDDSTVGSTTLKNFNNFTNLNDCTNLGAGTSTQDNSNNKFSNSGTSQQAYNNYNYSNYQGNYWQNNQFNSQSEYFNQETSTAPEPNFQGQNFPQNNPQDWIKEEKDIKPKINIISDIKLPPPAFNDSQDQKKINIISDIKIEPKKEEPEAEVKPEPEIKVEEPKTENLNENGLPPIVGTSRDSKEDGGIPYDWAVELLKDYVPGCIENSAKMEILFCIIRESIALGDRLLVFSQSLITLDLIEQFLHMNLVPGDTVKWARNSSYYRLDGSTSALEREKLINEFNSNPKIHVFLVSTRAGSLGINLIGANRVVVLDASWNPCHDTQAVCRVYRYGQRKPCFVYRLVVDNCLEKKIYDRQINKQGMSDRVVDECNPDAHLTLKDVSTLCWDDKQDEGEEQDWSHTKDNYIDVVLQKVLVKHGRRLNKEPFQHESLLVDRKEKKLSQQEKRLAKKGYEREKQAARQPSYGMTGFARGGHRPVASVRPMQQGNDRPSRWIPAEHWQRQGMTAQEMTLPLDVVIPTNQPEKGNIVLKAGQKVLVLKSPKGVYMQLESGKIVAIKTAIKVKGKSEDSEGKLGKPIIPPTMKVNPSPQKRLVKSFQPAKFNVRSVRQSVPNLVTRIQSITPPNPHLKKIQMVKSTIKPFQDQKEGDLIPNTSSSDEDHPEKPLQRKIQVKKQVSVQRTNSNLPGKKTGTSALEQLEQTTSSISDNRPFQDSLDSITSGYNHLEDSEGGASPKHNDSNENDEVAFVGAQPPQPISSQYPSQATPSNQAAPIEPKVENPQEYSYNYYNYNVPYVAGAPPPPPPQGYVYPPQHQPPYEVMPYAGQAPPPQGPPQAAAPPPPAAQPQYNYAYQTYPPQAYHAPPPNQPYDYNNAPPPPHPPPQGMYAGYHQPYPPPPQQYTAYVPPPGAAPPPTGAPAPPYPEYQYPQAPPNYYPST